MTGDQYRPLTAAAVLLVAAIAAVVSFVHVGTGAGLRAAALAASCCRCRLTAVAAASLVMLRAARAGMATPWLARTMLGLAVTATLAANIGYGAAVRRDRGAAVRVASGRLRRLRRDGHSDVAGAGGHGAASGHGHGLRGQEGGHPAASGSGHGGRCPGHPGQRPAT